MRLEVVDEPSALAACAEDWNRLAEEAPQGLAMLTHTWVSAYLEHMLEPGERWLCALAWEGSELRGVLPVVVKPHRVLGNRRPYLTGLFDGHTRSGDAVTAPQDRQATTMALIDALLEAESRALAVELPSLRDGSPTIAAAQSGPDRLPTLMRRQGPGSFLPTAGSVDEYRSAMGKNFRRNLRKARNRLEKEPGVETVFVSGAEITDLHVERFLALEASGWKGQAGTAVSLTPSLAVFYRSLSRALAERGWIEWHELWADGQLLAGHMALRFAGSLALNRIAYDEDAARYTPGNLLLESCIERAFADGEIHTLDFVSHQPWHANWNTTLERYHQLSLLRRGAVPLLLSRAPAAAEERARKALGPARRRARARLKPSGPPH